MILLPYRHLPLAFKSYRFRKMRRFAMLLLGVFLLTLPAHAFVLKGGGGTSSTIHVLGTGTSATACLGTGTNSTNCLGTGL